MKKHRVFFAVLWFQIVLDVVLGALFIWVGARQGELSFVGTVIISHLFACYFIYRDGRRLRSADWDVWTRAMKVAREVHTAYFFFFMMLVLGMLAGTEDIVGVVFPGLASLITFGIWIQMVGPRLSDQADVNDVMGRATMARLLQQVPLPRRTKRSIMRNFTDIRRPYLQMYVGSILVDFVFIILFVPFFSNGILLLLPVATSHMAAMVVVYVWAKRAQDASTARWIHLTQTGRQLVLAQAFLYFLLLLQVASIGGPVIDMTVAAIQLLIGGSWILIVGQTRTAYVESMTEIATSRSLQHLTLKPTDT